MDRARIRRGRDDILPKRVDRRRARASLTVILTVVVGASALVASAASSASASATFAPTADAYVDSGTPDSNYGAAVDLRTDNLPTRQRGYLRFAVSGLTGAVHQATLRVYANWTNPVGVAVHPVSDTTWGEATVTYTNAPPMGATTVNSQPTTQGAWLDIDVTSLVTGNGALNLGLTASLLTGDAAHPHRYPQNDLASRESGATAPQLVVVTDMPATTTVQSTTTTVQSTTTTTVAPTGPCGTAAAPPARYDHVVIVMYENKRLTGVIGNPAAPYANSLARACGYATQYSDAGSQFKSLPNYIALTSGLDNTPVQTDCVPSVTCSTTVDNLFRQVRAKGGTAISYQESMGSNCRLTNFGTYAPKHNPAAYYVGGSDRAACATDDVDYSSFDPNNLPTLAFVTPNLISDSHDGTVAQGDAWAQTNIAAILNGSSYRAGRTAVLWLWDENTPTPNVVIAPSVRPGSVVSAPVNHYGSLRAVERMLGLPLLGNAATAFSLRKAFGI
jgi:hypothetical protein